MSPRPLDDVSMPGYDVAVVWDYRDMSAPWLEELSGLRLSHELLDEGFKVLPIRVPTVPPGTDRLRISLNAMMTAEDIERFGAALRAKDHSLRKELMNLKFIYTRPGTSRLILLFAGWGMSPRPLDDVSMPGYDVAVVWDYRDMSAPWLEELSGLRLSHELLDEGFKVLPIRVPTVPPGTDRLRISLNAMMTAEDIERFGAALRAKITALEKN